METYLYEDLYKQENTHWWHISKRDFVAWCIKAYGKKGGKILDIGCGTGEMMRTLSSYGEVSGIDIAPEAIDYCKKRGFHDVRVASAEKTLFPDDTFSIITALDVLEHVDDKQTVIECFRILQPGGILIVTVPAYQFLWSYWDIVLHHKRRYSKKMLSSLFKEVGMRVLFISYMYSFLLFPVMVVRFYKTIFQSKKYGSDFSLNNTISNHILKSIARAERWFAKQ